MKSKRKTTIRARIMRLVVISILIMALPSLCYLLLHLTLHGNSALLVDVFNKMSPFIAAFTALELIGGVFVSLRVSGGIGQSIRDTTEALHTLSKGGLNVHVDHIPNDEIGEAAESLNEFSTKLRTAVSSLIQYLDALAEGDLAVKPSYTWNGDWGELNVVLTKISSSFNSIFSTVRSAADQSSNGADQVASASQALAQGATEQASSIEELSATITEISEHVKKNASNATAASDASSAASGKLTEADKSMQQMMDAMDAINESSQKISNIIKTIDDISFQTNILALNAAVEAARAGTAGKGFAVVADEVRNLASKSAEAAKDTTALIEDSIRAVESGTSIAKVTQQTLLEVKASSSDTDSLINEIAVASNQQATSIGQITQGVQQISAVVQTNSATAEQSAAASKELADQARSLKKAVERITLADRPKTPSKASAAHPTAEPEPSAAPQRGAAEAPAAPLESAAASSFATNDKYI